MVEKEAKTPCVHMNFGKNKENTGVEKQGLTEIYG